MHGTVKSASKSDWTYDVEIVFTQCKVSKETLETKCCCRDIHMKGSAGKKTRFCWHIVLCLWECINDTSEENETHIANQPVPEEEYVVERILATKHENGEQLFLVKWAGYKVNESTWEKKSNLDHAQECVKYYFSLINNSKLHYISRNEAN